MAERTEGSERLRTYLERRRARGLTLEKFAGELGTTKAAVSMWRAGKRRPGTRWVQQLYERTRIPVSAWLRPSR